MRAGQEVVYVARGKAKAAVVRSLAGNGPSGFKLLNLAVGGDVVERVPHEGDADGGAFWAFEAPKPKRRKK